MGVRDWMMHNWSMGRQLGGFSAVELPEDLDAPWDAGLPNCGQQVKLVLLGEHRGEKTVLLQIKGAGGEIDCTSPFSLQEAEAMVADADVLVIVGGKVRQMITTPGSLEVLFRSDG